MITFVLVNIGALNWGLVGFFDFNLVSSLLSGWPMVENWVYVLVGLSAVYELAMHKNLCMMCSGHAKMHEGEMKS